MLLVDLQVSVVIWSFIGACIARSRRFQLIKVLRAHYPRPTLVLQVIQLEMETVAVAVAQMVSKTEPPYPVRTLLTKLPYLAAAASLKISSVMVLIAVASLFAYLI